jgi:hypothetical protein
MKLYENWKTIATKAWSARLMALAFLLTMAEAMLPFFDDAFPRRVFATLSGLAVAGAFMARLIAQRDV